MEMSRQLVGGGRSQRQREINAANQLADAVALLGVREAMAARLRGARDDHDPGDEDRS